MCVCVLFSVVFRVLSVFVLPIEALFYLFIRKLWPAICEYIKEIYLMRRYFVK